VAEVKVSDAAGISAVVASRGDQIGVEFGDVDAGQAG